MSRRSHLRLTSAYGPSIRRYNHISTKCLDFSIFYKNGAMFNHITADGKNVSPLNRDSLCA
jgi:hypothetical protein